MTKRELLTTRCGGLWQVSDQHLYYLCKRCPGVQGLHVNGCPNISSAGLLEVGQKLRLKRLSIANVPVTSETLQLILTKSRCMEELVISGYVRLVAVFGCCPSQSDATSILRAHAGVKK